MSCEAPLRPNLLLKGVQNKVVLGQKFKKKNIKNSRESEKNSFKHYSASILFSRKFDILGDSCTGFLVIDIQNTSCSESDRRCQQHNGRDTYLILPKMQQKQNNKELLIMQTVLLDSPCNHHIYKIFNTSINMTH